MSPSTFEVSIDHPTDRPNYSVLHLRVTPVSFAGFPISHETAYVSIAFSYATPIGINFGDGRGWIRRENKWGPTTGKHINNLPGNGPRVPTQEFERELSRIGFTIENPS